MQPGASLQDRFGRSISYLRVSVTEHCNFRCEYCSPAGGTPYFEGDEHLTSGEQQRILGLFARMGLQHVRFTGGEPLIHPRILDLVSHAAHLKVGKISISTNGILLEKLAQPLQKAGLNNLNISIDTLKPEVFRQVTRGGDLARVLRGIEAAKAAGIRRIKINTVLLRDVNGDDLEELAIFALDLGLDIRFIETMPLGQSGEESVGSRFLPAHEARKTLERHFGSLIPVASSRDNGPAMLYRVPGSGSSGRVGFITPLSENFCSSCNRVRLTSSGRLVYCLGSEDGMDLRRLLRNGDITDGQLIDAIQQGVWHEKPERHEFLENPARSSKIFMMRLGG